VASDDLLQDAIDELYSVAPAQFIAHRAALVGAAKQAADQAAAKAIGELRRPTQSAWTVNCLVRSDPAVTGELADLAERLRGAERALDGSAMRELSKERRRLIDDLVERAFATTAQTDPSPALRDEVTATLEAALADPDVAGQLETGTLLRAVRWSGFGAAGPALSAVPARSPSPRDAASGKSSDRKRLTPSKRAEPSARRAADREREQDRQRQLAEARDRLAVAKRDNARQKQRSDRLRREVETLRQRLDEARTQLGEAERALRAAQRDRQAADRALAKLLSDSSHR
jgi:hypothetical protein